ncbi:hypothetical protein PF008_g14520 [Phytophthora fragariae]|uniref:Uncharacterized protein n=1 Tax=Phytophthora fragariae TaxID=53985 RepID=A0A6G0RGU1_9STRA|nr:hypothetical protein PF008_g14520 [Phytophthora fragariae]
MRAANRHILLLLVNASFYDSGDLALTNYCDMTFALSLRFRRLRKRKEDPLVPSEEFEVSLQLIRWQILPEVWPYVRGLIYGATSSLTQFPELLYNFFELYEPCCTSKKVDIILLPFERLRIKVVLSYQKSTESSHHGIDIDCNFVLRDGKQ